MPRVAADLNAQWQQEPVVTTSRYSGSRAWHESVKIRDSKTGSLTAILPNPRDPWPRGRRDPMAARTGSSKDKERIWILAVRNAVVRKQEGRACRPEGARHGLSLETGRSARCCTRIQQWRKMTLSLGPRGEYRPVARTAKREKGLTFSRGHERGPDSSCRNEKNNESLHRTLL